MADSDVANAEPDHSLKYAGQPMMTATLAFKNGDNAATVRIELEMDVQPGDTLSLRDRVGDEFGRAEVVAVEETTVSDAIDYIRDCGARYPIDSAEYLISALCKYYKPPVGHGTEVTVIIYRPIEILGVVDPDD